MIRTLARAVSLRHRRWNCLFLLAATIVFTAFTGSAFAQPSIEYIYDEAGRLVGVIDGSGASAQYEYDPTGNVTAIRRFGPGDLAIVEFTPNAGPVGTAVEIHGVGFSTTASSNVVRFNGTAATVTSASTTKLVVVVPPAATTGAISVAVQAKTATSLTPFTVTANDGAPTITDFTPKIGAAGTAVAITGSNFESAPANNAVRFNIMSATVTDATPTQVGTKVPAGATSGPIQINTPNGTAISAADFIVPPAGYSADEIGTTTRIVIDGASQTLDTGAPGKVGLVSFKGTQGQHLGLGVSALTTTPANNSVRVSVFAPNGGLLLLCGTYSPPGGSCNLPMLPRTGTYTIAIVPPSAGTANLTLTLSSDITATLAIDAATATTFATARVGQNGRLSFVGEAGAGLNLLLTGNTFGPGSLIISVLRSNGALWYGTTLHSPGSAAPTSGTFELPSLPAKDTYSIFLDPSGLITGAVSAKLLSDATGALTIDGTPTIVSHGAGQKGRYTFTATEGQNLGLGISGVSVPTATVSIELRKPDNSLVGCGGFGMQGGSCDLDNLSAGKYSVEVKAAAVAMGLTLTLSNDLTGTLTPNAAPTTFSSSRVGQNARYTFTAAAGQNFSLLITDDTFGPGETGVMVRRPDGTVLAGTALTYNGSGPGTTGLFDFSVPADGTYTVHVDPRVGSAGGITLSLLSEASGTLTIDGTPLNASLLAGQNGRYTFSASAGQSLGLGVSGLSTTPTGGSVSLQIRRPDNTLFFCGPFVGPGGSCNLTNLTAGSYAVEVDPDRRAATLTLTLSSDVSGTLVINSPAPTPFVTTRAGQNARYSFGGAAQQALTVVLTNDSFAGSLGVTVLRADGSQFYSTTASSPGASAPSNRVIDLPPLPANETYSLFLDPPGISTGSVEAAIRAPATGNLVIDGPPTPVTLAQGQRGRFTVAATAGQSLGLGISGVAATPPGTVTVGVRGPNGELLGSTTLSSGSDSLTLWHPPAGTVTVEVDAGISAANLTFTLSSDITGALIANGGAQTFSTTRIGQNATYTFAATEGQRLALSWSGTTFPQAGITLLRPDSSPMFSGLPLSASGLHEWIAVAGTYQLLVDPTGGATGSVTFQLATDLIGTLPIDGAPLNLSLLPGQRARYTFTGAPGDNLGLGVSALSTTPASTQTTTVSVLDPAAAPIASTTLSAPGGSIGLPTLATAGTYTVAVTPSGSVTTQMTLTFSRDLTGSIVPNGPATAFSPTRVGQKGRYTFTGTGNQSAAMFLSGSTPGNRARVDVAGPSSGVGGTVVNGTDSFLWELGVLPGSGTYTVVVTPDSAAIGSLSLALVTDLTGVLTVNSPTATPIATKPGQNARFTFNGTAGARDAVVVTGIGTTPTGSSVFVSVVDGNNGTLKSCGSLTADTICDVPPLPANGTYMVVIDPDGANAASLNVAVKSDVTGTVTVDGSPTATTWTPGQNVRLTFTNATVGTTLKLTVSELSIAPAGAKARLRVRDPSGANIFGNTFWVFPNNQGTGYSINLPELSATGTYTIDFDPQEFASGAASFALATTIVRAIDIDGPPVTVSWQQNQQPVLNFSTATPDQAITLSFSNMSTTPAGGALRYTMSNATSWTTNITAPGVNLPQLPLASVREYSMTLTPQGPQSGTITVALINDVVGTLTIGGPAVSHTPARAGQSARFPFTNSTAGRQSTITINSSQWMSGQWWLVPPSGGATIGSFGVVTTPVNRSVTLSQTGTYTLILVPAGTSAGTVSLSVK